MSIRPRTGITLLAVLALAAPARAQNFDFKKLSFMSGCWSVETGKDQTVEENWSSISDNLMLATTRYLQKKKATSFEFTKVEKLDSSIVFVASTEFREPNTYTLKTLVDEFAVWENPQVEFPQRIMYRLASDGSLIARNELIEGYDPRNIEVRFQPVRCPGKGPEK